MSKYDSIHVDKKGKVRCDRCPAHDVNYGNNNATSHLQSHIFSHHRDLYDLNTTTTPSPVRTLDSSVVIAPTFEECYIRWMVGTYQPFDTCSTELFRNMCRSLNRSAPVLGRSGISQKVATNCNKLRQKLMTHLKGQYCALTCDHWSSVAQHSYFGATVHFIDQDWRLVSATLVCNHHVGQQTGHEIRRIIEETIDSFLQHEPCRVSPPLSACSINY